MNLTEYVRKVNESLSNVFANLKKDPYWEKLIKDLRRKEDEISSANLKKDPYWEKLIKDLRRKEDEISSRHVGNTNRNNE